MATNIVAKLTANGEAMTAEVNKSFGTMKTTITRVSKELGDVFGDNMSKGLKQMDVAVNASAANIKDIMANMRNTNGAIQIDTSGIKATIAARQQEVQVLEAVLAAKTRLAAKDSDASKITQVQLATTRAMIASHREEIAALTTKAQSYDNLQAEMVQVAVQQGKVNAVSGQTRAGMQQLSFQVSDVAASFATGINPMVIFAQQSGQVIQALGMMTTKSTGLLAALGSPMTLAILSVVTVLGQLYYANKKAGEGAEDQAKKEKTLTDRIKEQNESLMRNIELQGQRQQKDLESAKSVLGIANGEIVKTSKAITDAQAQIDRLLNNPIALSKDSTAGKISTLQERIKALQATLAKQITERDTASQGVRAASVPIINRRIDGQFDKATAETNRYEEALGKLQDQLTKGQISQSAYEKGAVSLRRQHEANTAAIEASTKAQREANKETLKLPSVTGQEVARLIGAPITSSKRSAAENAAVGGAKNSLHLTDQAIDIPLTLNGKPFTKEGIRAALEPAGVIIKELLGPGDKGHSDHFHIEFDRKRASSDKVTSEAAEAAKKAQDALAASLKNVVDLFDPAAAAASEYRLQLQEIKKLETAGVAGQGISSEDAVRYRNAALEDYSSKLAAIENTRHMTIMGNMSKEFQAAGDVADEKAAADVKAYLDQWQEVTQKKVKLDQDEASKQKEQFEDLANFYEQAFNSGGRSIWSNFKQMGKRALAEVAAQATIKLLGGGAAANGGGLFGGLINNGINGIGNLLGLNKSKNAQQGGSGGDVSGSIGGATGLLNKVKIPGLGGLGDIAGGAMLAFSLFGSVLKSTKRGSATLGFSGGELGVGSTNGNSGSRISAAKSGIGAVGDLLNQIAEGLGGNVTGAGSVSLGIRKKTYVVDPTGKGRTKGTGVLKFEDEQDAIESAVRDALQDGVIAGISAASKNILASGQDLQKAIQKASLIESIPKALKARLNPVGAALDDLNAKWDRTIAALKEGGATAEQMADAEKLYRLERQDALTAANDNLKEFINSLNFGSSSTYSLVDQSKSARANLDNYLGNINSGNFAAVDQEKYLAAAQSFLEIQRELGGSGTGWFNSVDELRTATQKLADGLAQGTNSAAGTRDPFAELTATSTQATAEILAQQSGMLINIENYLSVLANGASGGSGFIGADRSFMKLA